MAKMTLDKPPGVGCSRRRTHRRGVLAERPAALFAQPGLEELRERFFIPD